MPYTDIKTDLILNEISEEQLHSQENLPPNQLWLTNEDGDKSPIGQLEAEVEELKQTKANLYPVVGKYSSNSLTTATTYTFNMSDYINAEDYVEGAVYEVYIQGYFYGTDSHKTTWATDLLPTTFRTFNISGNGRQNGFVGSVVASSYIQITLETKMGSGEYCYAMFTGYRRLY